MISKMCPLSLTFSLNLQCRLDQEKGQIWLWYSLVRVPSSFVFLCIHVLPSKGNSNMGMSRDNCTVISWTRLFSLQHVIFHSETEYALMFPWLNGGINEAVSGLRVCCLFCVLPPNSQGNQPSPWGLSTRLWRNYSGFLLYSAFPWKHHLKFVLWSLTQGPQTSVLNTFPRFASILVPVDTGEWV